MVSSEPRKPVGAEPELPGPPAGPELAGAGPTLPGGAAEGAASRSETAGMDRQAALRALRNLEATEARLERNARREAEETRSKLVQELLPVLDNLDRTIHAAQGGRNDPALLQGVRMVRQQLEGVLRGYGVERIQGAGPRLDH